jgi:hypothetical protein
MILLSSFDINNIILFLGDSDEKFSHGSWTLNIKKVFSFMFITAAIKENMYFILYLVRFS